jgi:uncharacterized protein YegJ (DUF2314 family)
MAIPFQVERPIFVGIRFPGKVGMTCEQWAQRLSNQGFDVRIDEGAGSKQFRLRIKHPQWGKAYVLSDPRAPRIDEVYFQFSLGLSPEERAACLEGEVDLTVYYKPVAKNLLRDKKTLLRFARAVMGDDALALVDTFSTLVWTPYDLDVELMHDAELDVESLYAVHAVQSEERVEPSGNDEEEEDRPFKCEWFHTHGVAELGGFDIDILRPHHSFTGGDIVRAMVYACVEGDLAPDEAEFPAFHPGGNVRLVPVREFHQLADASDAKSRELDEAHGSNRVVLCDIAGAGKKRMFGLTFGKGSSGAAVRSAQCFQREIPENIITPFSHHASALMAQRALATVNLFREFREEFADLHVPCIVKLGIRTDRAKKENTKDAEHMWFDVHSVKSDKLEGTLLNEPRDVQALRQGHRGWFDLSHLSDWKIMTPLGEIDPRNVHPAMRIRSMPADMRQKFAEMISESMKEE